MDVQNQGIKVSVCIVTYNHEKYIRQCLQSLIDQKTSFRFEIIVGDDASTDSTRSIIEEFVYKFPNIVKAIFQEKNTGGSENYFSVHQSAKGQYIAHMDGDDYALPGKLQAQADFLDNNPDCNIVWHRMYVKNESNGKCVEDLIDMQIVSKVKFTRAHLLRLISVGFNSSKMYRSCNRDFTLPDFVVLDFFANVEQVGDLGYATFCSNSLLGVYRTGIGISSVRRDKVISLICDTLSYFLKKYPEHRSSIAQSTFILFVAALKNKRWKDCRKVLPILFSSFSFSLFYQLWSERSIIKMLRIPNTVRASKKKGVR